jgi:23S rRNA (uracil1939-C5)-methyltransferase
MKIDFNIDHIDPLGQGVSKQEGRVTFIKKTLPGESGESELISAKKGVQFAKLTNLLVQSKERITPECTHFNDCNGCDFLHTSYVNEKSFKINSLKRQLSKFNVPEIGFFEAPERFGYRNRLQLHYNLKLKILGFQNSEFKIVEVPNCIIGNLEIKNTLKRLYQDQHWITLLKGQPNEGHIEIYFKDNSVHTKVNSHYADGGFTQVNQEMNLLLNNFLTKNLRENLKDSDIVLDLFGGNGNLSKLLKNQTVVVDNYAQVPQKAEHQKFLSLDLYDKTALATLKKNCRTADWIIIDPPRSGLKNLSEFILAFSPLGFIYVSCQSASFIRDTLPLLTLYELNSVQIFDLFPGTHHFETVAIFTRRKLTL